jgi:3-phenylpropionate/trans-cinnamate dioxygenase ferredoxin subunit
MSDAGEFVPVAKLDEVPEGDVKCVKVGGQGVVLCRVEGRVYAVGDVCTHDSGPLCGGALDGHAIECPRHGARFDIRNGQVLAMPAAVPIPSYPVRVVDGTVTVRLS